MKGELFKGLAQLELQDRTGYSGKLPVFYPEVSSLAVALTASTKRVRELLPHPAMHPVELYPGRCLVGISAFEYRVCDIDPYNELSISFPVTVGRRAIPGLHLLASLARRTFAAYVWQLPVTTERARYGGVELYGFPKFLAEITIKSDGGWVEATLGIEGRRILAVRVRQGPTRPGKRIRYRAYTVKDGVPLVANVLTLPHQAFESMDSSEGALELGSGHPICERLGSLDLGAKPLLSQHFPECESVLFGPRNLVDD